MTSWMPAAVLAAALGADSEPGSEDASSIEPGARRTVENRLFTKARKWHFRLGGTYLGREDFWISPGLTAEVGYHPLERLGFELSTSLYFSTLDAAAEELRRTQRLLPDAEQPILRVVVGPRWAFAYGKLLVEDTQTVVHFDASLLLRLGGLITDQGLNFGGDVGLGGQIGFGDRWLVWAEISAWVGYEARTNSSVGAGPAGSIGVGVQL